jgi:hypothetical protein
MKNIKNILTEHWILFIYIFGHTLTFIFLTFFDNYNYNWWNWIFVIPFNLFLATIWPIYWILLHWIF